jgi:hypothetical protein
MPPIQDEASAPADAGHEPVPAEAAPTLEETLRARCAEPAGPSDGYFSGADLTARLVGRWFNCEPAESSPIQDGDGAGIAFLADGTWALLDWSASRERLDAATSPSSHGTYRYYFFVNADAGTAADAGVTSGDVARDDTKSRTPLVVYLDRTGTDGFNFTFSTTPRQMMVVESASALHAHYVPID